MHLVCIIHFRCTQNVGVEIWSTKNEDSVYIEVQIHITTLTPNTSFMLIRASIWQPMEKDLWRWMEQIIQCTDNNITKCNKQGSLQGRESCFLIRADRFLRVLSNTMGMWLFRTELKLQG